MKGADRSKLAARLAHDVGKYVARAARNMPPRGATPAMVAMLATDLYSLAGGRRASAVLAELAGPFGEGDERLATARSLLEEADRLEDRLRAAEPAAVERGRAIALEVQSLVLDFARMVASR
ncbi:MAG: hypothetical protein HYY06_26505 [Deltaproteobacteria bacterium]|nr:hypothetical protein [Deltaproteobacteria bacterium]